MQRPNGLWEHHFDREIYEDERYPSNTGDLSTATERYALKDLSPISAIGVEVIP